MAISWAIARAGVLCTTGAAVACRGRRNRAFQLRGSGSASIWVVAPQLSDPTSAAWARPAAEMNCLWTSASPNSR